MDLEGIAGRSSIVSARRECRNARRQVIAVTDDHARHQISPATPIVIVVPGFGKTQMDYLPLSFFLAANRLRVLRYDHTNHVGQSDGDVLQTTLRGMQVDLEQVIDFARTTWPTAPLTIVAEDVGARVALKAMGKNPAPTGHLLLINPVLDLQAALLETYRHDVLADHAQGLRRGAANLWGLNVNLDQFLGDALGGDYQSLSGSARDMAALQTAPVIFTTPHPSEPARGQAAASLRSLPSAPAVVEVRAELSSVSPVADERHRVAFQTVYQQISVFSQQPHAAGDLREVPLREVQRQYQLEQERVRIRHHVSQSTRDALWIAHVAQLPQLGNLHDYWVLREELYRLLLPLEPSARILEIGCGHGDMARAILTNRAYARSHTGGPPQLPLHYVGLGHSQESVDAAQRSMSAFQRELTTTFASTAFLGGLLETDWMPYEWDSALPLADQSFDRILCHLSLCFSPSPLRALRDALRTLAPEGTLLITCLQPHSDLSELYRRHLHAAAHDEFGAPGQIVLHYLGRLREAIRHGLLHRYERDALGKLLIHAGAAPVHVRPLFDGQLLVALARKGKSPG
jgi:SAM-dependent methyltransferase